MTTAPENPQDSASKSAYDQQKQQRLVLNIYALLGVSLLMMALPYMTAAFAAMILFLGTLIAAYIIRGRAGAQSYAANHMTYLIRTIWIGSFFALITLTLASLYIISLFDPAPMQTCAERLLSMPNSDPQTLQALLQPCMDEFMRVNREIFITGSLIAIGPVVLYFLYRIAKGLSRAFKQHRIGAVKHWF